MHTLSGHAEVHNHERDHRHQALCVIFAQFGLPEQFVTDNGPQWSPICIGGLCTIYQDEWSETHSMCTRPYHPATNGLAERFVQSLEGALKASVNNLATVSLCSIEC
jgi:transposase InsO family protein